MGLRERVREAVERHLRYVRDSQPEAEWNVAVEKFIDDLFFPYIEPNEDVEWHT